MPPPPVIAFADDLTGAAEIAAIGHRHGLPARVVARLPSAPAVAPGLTVYDTDSRLEPADLAARRVTEAVRHGAPAGAWCFKKTDSVLRGPVQAECRAFAAALGRAHVLLVPCNPSLARTIRDGRYFVAGIPLDRTAFSRDPHHPAHSASVTALLRTDAKAPVTLATHGTPLPRAADFIVGEAETVADLDHWAACVDATVAPAGGAEFFAANLRRRGHHLAPRAMPPALPGPTLVISGTTSPESRSRLQHLASKDVPVCTMPEALFASPTLPATALERWFAEVGTALAARGGAIATPPPRLEPGAAAAHAIRSAFAALAGRLHAAGKFRHLVIEGGATAATILQALDCPELDVVHEWSQGVITLRPPARPDQLLTLKPGSYAWPDGWWQHLRLLPVS